MIKWIAAIALACLLVRPALAAAPREVMDEDVDRAIGELQRYLFAQQKADGSWEHQWNAGPMGGCIAMPLFALLESGIDPGDDRIKKGLDALLKIQTENLYVRAVRTIVLAQVVGAAGKESPYRKQLEMDIKWLTAQAMAQGGAWGYAGPERYGDNSCSQFALLALWEADLAGAPVPAALIAQVERTWLARQQEDGGWTYPGHPTVKTDSTLSMTAAGLASLFVTQDVLTNTCTPYPNQKALDRGWKYLSDHFDGLFAPPDTEYRLFCVQRVGLASGSKFIGTHDWFAEVAAKLAEPNPQGRAFSSNRGSLVQASFELVFLSRGRVPLTINKLQHGPEGQWNVHTRDVPHFTEYMRRTLERRLRWQVVEITGNMQQLLDAPILLVTGQTAPEFTAEQWDKLREYSLRGGTLLLVPTHGNKAFFDAATEKLKTLYAPQHEQAGADYTLEPVPAEHPLYSAYEKIANGPTAAPLWAVSDGTRLLAVLTKGDPTCSWQRRSTAQGKADYGLGVNFWMYATGANSLRMRLRPVFMASSGEVRQKVKVAWLKHGGNWCSQPYALQYLSDKLVAENRLAIDLDVGVPADAAKLAGHNLVWMTGSAAFKLSPAEQAALKQYLTGGGTLFLNAVGGSREFNASATALLDQLFDGLPNEQAVMADSPLLTGKCADFRGPILPAKFARTRDWQKLVPTLNAPPLRTFTLNGQVAVIYAANGIHDALDGHTVAGALSYMPWSARDIAENVVLFSMIPKTAPASAPASGPASGPASAPK